MSEDQVYREHGMKTGLVMMAAWMAAASTTPLAAAQLYQWKDAQGRAVYSDLTPPASTGSVQQKNFKGSFIEGGESYATKVAREKHPVTLYTSACGAPCDKARQLLSERGVPYSSKDLQASEEARNEVQKLTGKLNVPVLTVGSDKFEGFESGQWQAALDRAGYPKPLPGRKPVPQATGAPALAPAAAQ
jgi:glutaredoxin